MSGLVKLCSCVDGVRMAHAGQNLPLVRPDDGEARFALVEAGAILASTLANQFVINDPLCRASGRNEGNQDGNVWLQRSLAPNLVSGSGSAVPGPAVCTGAKSCRRQTQPAPRLDTEWFACAVFSGGAEGVVSQSRPRCDDRGRNWVGGHGRAGRSRA